MEIHKTKDFKKFKYRHDNRDVDMMYARSLAKSIQSRNMLEFRPIECNEDFEVIDGQHRLEAAKLLGVEIYYMINSNIKAQDMIQLNISKSWTPRDFLNYYTKNNYPEYLKLQKFIKENLLDVRVGIRLTTGKGMKHLQEFKMGNYVFNEEDNKELFQDCWHTVDMIKKIHTKSCYTGTVRFWNAMVRLFRDERFNRDRWFTNLKKMIERFGVRATEEDYLRLFMEVHNWHNNIKIDLLDKDY